MFGCLLVPALPLACELADRPGLRGRPVVLSDEAGGHVVEVTPEGARRSIRRGMTLREATGYCPQLVVLEPHPLRTALAGEGLVRAMGCVTPVVEQAAPGVIFGDLRGTERIYPEMSTIASVVLASTPAGLGPRLGFARQRFTAFAAAHTATPRGWHTITTGEAAFLADKPTDWLPLSGAEREWLRSLGIVRLGDFAALPRTAVEAQLGRPGGYAWLAARGEDPTLLRQPGVTQESVGESVDSEPPLVSRESILLQFENLLSRAAGRVNRRFARTFRLMVATEDGRTWQRQHLLKESTGDRQRLWSAIRPFLEAADYPGPIARLELELGNLTAERGRQVGPFLEHIRKREHLDEAVRQLKIQYTAPVLNRVVEREPWSRIPERRFALVDYDP